jgi:hypothetical protein
MPYIGLRWQKSALALAYIGQEAAGCTGGFLPMKFNCIFPHLPVDRVSGLAYVPAR